MMIQILIADDDRFLQKLYSMLFNKTDIFIIATASDGSEVINKYKEMGDQIDLVVMDYRMPIKNGIQATEEILKIDPSAVVLMVSANKELEVSALSCGAKAFIEKPFEFDDLKSCIRRLLKK